MIKSKRIANCNNPLSDLKLVGITQFEAWNIVGVDFKYGNIRLGVSSLNAGIHLATILESHFNLFCTFYDMVVGQDKGLIGKQTLV